MLLWLDPEQQFVRLVDHLEPPLLARQAQILRHDPLAGTGQLALKVALLRVEADPGSCAVVYLPGFDRRALEPRADGGVPTLWSVYEYRYKGAVWGLGNAHQVGAVPEPPTLLDWLQAQGVQVATEKARRELGKGGADALIGRYAEWQRTTAPAEWPRPLRLSDVEALPGGDPRDALRRLLAAPTNEVKGWGQERPTVLSGIASFFGLKAPKQPDDPEALADAFALDLALAEAWDAFGRPGDFPYASRLPAKPDLIQRQAAFLRDDVLSHTNLGPLFRERLGRLEAGYDLSGWAKGRQGHPGGLPVLARARWRDFLQRLNAAGESGWKTARDLLVAEGQAIRAAAEAPWSHLDPEIHWQAANDLVELVRRAEEAATEAASLQTAGDLVAGFAQGWWQADRLHPRVRAVAGGAGLETLRTVADAVYLDYAERLAERLCALVEAAPVWPPAGTTGVERLREALWKVEPRTRRAIIVTDACRWDLAMDLRARLAGSDCALTPVLATLPTNTPFGMAALMPVGNAALTVDFGAGKASIRAGGAEASGANLATRDGRKAFLQAVLRDPTSGKPLVDFLDLTPLVRGARVPATPIVVVFDNDLDEQGHKGMEQLPRLVETFVGEWKRAVDCLHEAGIDTVHLVTDHGFLLLPPDRVESLGTPQLPPTQALYKHVRWSALKPDAPAAEVVKVPLPAAPGAVMLGIPRGVRTLVKSEPYMHGGISLQECVIPHLVSRRVLARQRVGVEVVVTSTGLSGGTVPVVLRPALQGGQASLGGLEPLTVRVWVETVPEAGGAVRVVAGPYEQEVADTGEQKPPLFLKEGLDLRTGQALRLRAVDAESGRELASVPLTLLRDWE